MQNIPNLFVGLFLVFSSYGQVPNSMSFQAVVRNTEGEVINNQQIQVKLSILRGSSSGTVVYSELHTPTTNNIGLFTLQLGEGTIVSGDFSAINWWEDIYFLKRELDPDGGTNYLITGISQFLSVPYAFHSKVADTVKNAPDTSSTNELQKLSVSPYGDTLYLSDGNYAIVPGITLANQLVWNRTYGGSYNDRAYSIQQTSDGGYIVAGFTDSNDGDITDGNNRFSDIWILKLNPDGTKAWDKTYGGSGSEYANSIQQTSDGGYIVAGYTNSSDGDITDGNNGAFDFWILKLNSDGTKAWDKTYGGSGIEYANSIQQTSDGGYIVAGFTDSNDGDITDGNNVDFPRFYDFWILKLNSDGTKAWDKTYRGSYNDRANSIQQTSDGGYIVAGFTDSSDGDISDGNNGAFDFWILKLNSDGTKAWDKTYGGSISEEARSIQQTSDGGYIVAGRTLSSYGDISDGNNGFFDMWILKLNSDGTKAWDKTYGGSDFDEANSIQQTIDGGFIVAGFTDSNDGDITDGNNWNNGFPFPDMWILKLNSDGTKAWDKTYGGSRIEYANSIQQTSDGGYIVAGYTNSSDGDITDGNNGFPFTDMWILKLNKDGNVY